MPIDSKIRVRSNQGGIAIVVVLILLVVLVVVAYAALSQLQTPSTAPVGIKDFGIKPSTFKTDEEGQLSFTIENFLQNDSIRATMYFETNKNVEIYQGGSPLPAIGGNYTLTKQLDPSEISELKFTVKGTIDVGDNSRDYYIREYCYVNDVCFDVQTVSFTIQRD
jgi:hypothetical protein